MSMFEKLSVIQAGQKERATIEPDPDAELVIYVKQKAGFGKQDTNVFEIVGIMRLRGFHALGIAVLAPYLSELNELIERKREEFGASQYRNIKAIEALHPEGNPVAMQLTSLISAQRDFSQVRFTDVNFLQDGEFDRLSIVDYVPLSGVDR